MEPQDRLLLRKLITVLVIKGVVLAGLWWGFVREQRVPVDAGATAQQVLGPLSLPGNNPTSE